MFLSTAQDALHLKVVATRGQFSRQVHVSCQELKGFALLSFSLCTIRAEGCGCNTFDARQKSAEPFFMALQTQGQLVIGFTCMTVYYI